MRSGDTSTDKPTDRATPTWTALMAAVAIAAAASPALAQEGGPAPAGAQDDANQTDLVLLEADSLTDDSENRTIIAEGDVQARYQGRTLRADRLVYSLDTGVIRASGGVELIEADGSVQYAEDMQVDEGLTLGVATELRARFQPSGVIAARSAVRRQSGDNQLDHVVYTSCPICEDGSQPPTWSLRARSAVQDPDTAMISYRDAVLEVAGVPVFYAPYFSHPDPSAGPRSGFLQPDLGRNRRLGAFYEQPYVWAISPHQDLTVSPRVHQNVRPLLGFEYRQRFWSGDIIISGSATVEQDFDSEGDRFGDDTPRGHLFATGRFQVNEDWAWGFGAERASDDLYLRRYDLPGAGEGRGPFIGNVTRLITQVFVERQSPNSYASLSTIAPQGLREADDSRLLPLILPLGEISHTLTEPVFDGQVRLGASTAVLERTEGFDSARASVGAGWRRDWIMGPGLVVSPFAEARTDFYRVRDNASGAPEETFNRSLALGGVELSWPFVSSGQGYAVIVEPVVMAAVGTQGGNDARIVNEDSQAFELDDSNLFRPNAAPNFDLWEPGPRLSAGLRATARTDSGATITGLVGRRWRSDSEPAFTPANNLEGRASDWVGAVGVDFGDRFSANVRARARDGSFALQRLDARVAGRVGRFTVSTRYLNVDGAVNAGDRLEEVSADVGVRLNGGWSVSGGFRRDLDSDTNLQHRLAVIYEDDCSFLEFAYTRSETFDRRLGPSEGFRIRVGLTTLGVIGGGN
jgi:LPS-assembly protein